ncbi:MAG: hypothetical protein N4A62_04955 [Marinisporobacter sp.]|jgi:hypothetical protein|nr:hypothetical protein [Marinisporobacter sp.]
MDEKVIDLLEKINEKLEKIYTILKNFDKKESINTESNKYKTKGKKQNKKIKKSEYDHKDDVLKNWESKMPYDEVLKKMYTHKNLKE